MEGKYIAGMMAVVVSVILVGSVLAPIIENSSGGAGWDETVTTTYNEDPDLQFDKQTSNFALDMSVTIGDDVVITNGEDTVTAPYGAMFLLAADNSAIFISVTDDLIFTWSDNDGKHSLTLAGDFTAVIADDKLTINDGTAHDAPLPASYLYVPSSTGGYGSFASGELAKRVTDPVIAAGSFAGAVAYNSSVTLVGDAMIMSVDGTDTLVNSVEWVAAPAAEPAVVPFDPSSITIQPLDPSVLDPTPDASIMSVPTPTYTDGVWGYDLDSQNIATIVSYSGTGGDVVIPSTVGGYTVETVGKGGYAETVFSPSLSTITSLTISEGIKKLSDYAFYQCKVSGKVTLPSTLTSWGRNMFADNIYMSGLNDDHNIIIPENVSDISISCFSNCGVTGAAYIGSNVTDIKSFAFNKCKISSLIINMDANSTIASGCFNDTANLKEILNLGSLELTTTSYGMNADVIQDYIGADVYIAPATLTEVIHHSGGSGSYSALYSAILITVIIAVLVGAAALFIGIRQY